MSECMMNWRQSTDDNFGLITLVCLKWGQGRRKALSQVPILCRLGPTRDTHRGKLWDFPRRRETLSDRLN
jgi:hypothetical protein